MQRRDYEPHAMFGPEELLKRRQLDPARLSARQAMEAIRDIAAETRPHMAHEYYMQRIMVFEILVGRTLGEEA